jgi:glycosyltransferase involved in cell wall biosynthesis
VAGISTFVLVKKERSSTLKPRVFVTSNSLWNLFNFRYELISEIKKSYDLYLVAPFDIQHELEMTDKFKNFLSDIKFIDLHMSRRSTAVFGELKLLFSMLWTVKKIKPDIVLSYTIKNNLYFSFIRLFYDFKLIATVTGIGSSQYSRLPVRLLLAVGYKLLFRNSHVLFLQNSVDLLDFKTKTKNYEKFRLIPGSGINLKAYETSSINTSKRFQFLMVSRLLKSKGVLEFTEAARLTKDRSPRNCEFILVGNLESSGKDIIDNYELDSFRQLDGCTILPFGQDIGELLHRSSCVVLPSYREGLSRILLEACATGRPILTTPAPGCVDLINLDLNGMLSEIGDHWGLAENMLLMLSKTDTELNEMGSASRDHVEEIYDVRIVIDEYLKSMSS